MRWGYCTITWGGLRSDPAGVTSIKDLWYRTEGSLDSAARDIASAGYQGVEVFDGNLVALGPEPLSAVLQETGVELVSVYTGANFVYDDALPDEMARITTVIKTAAEAGAANLVVGGGARRTSGTTEQDFDRLGAALDAVVALADEHGLVASYHPHLGTIAESPDEIDEVFARSRIGFCPDTAHLAAGGGDPAALIRRYGDRVRLVHLKDLDRPDTFLPLGRGELDFGSVISALLSIEYDDWVMVELDSYDGPPIEAAQHSRSVLEDLSGGELG